LAVTFNALFVTVLAVLFLLSIGDAVSFARAKRKDSKIKRELLFGLLWFAALLNFFLFLLIDVLLGGDALNGKVEDRHYYLGSHGAYTEVSHDVFLYSTVHASLAFVGMFAAVVGGLFSRRDALRGALRKALHR